MSSQQGVREREKDERIGQLQDRRGGQSGRSHTKEEHRAARHLPKAERSGWPVAPALAMWNRTAFPRHRERG